jgi:hypothetical protein
VRAPHLCDRIDRPEFAAFDRDLDGISRQTMEDHYKLYEGYGVIA